MIAEDSAARGRATGQISDKIPGILRRIDRGPVMAPLARSKSLRHLENAGLRGAGTLIAPAVLMGRA
jgi:hypothetical protein